LDRVWFGTITGGAPFPWDRSWPAPDERCGQPRDSRYDRRTTAEEESVSDPFDVTLEDQDLLGEVELTTNLIIAASEVDRPLTQEEIDRVLEVRGEAAAAAGDPAPKS
jgi:hypothetical protein